MWKEIVNKDILMIYIELQKVRGEMNYISFGFIISAKKKNKFERSTKYKTAYQN